MGDMADMVNDDTPWDGMGPDPEERAEADKQETNMYDCTLCPKCNSDYRYPTNDGIIHCDECGFDEPASATHYAYKSPTNQEE